MEKEATITPMMMTGIGAVLGALLGMILAITAAIVWLGGSVAVAAIFGLAAGGLYGGIAAAIESGSAAGDH